jgi:hypothetical protein
MARIHAYDKTRKVVYIELKYVEEDRVLCEVYKTSTSELPIHKFYITDYDYHMNVLNALDSVAKMSFK